MTVFNSQRYLREAVDSVLGQTFGDLEFLIVDDASTDGTWEILTEYAARDARVKLLRHARNLGMAIAINTGWECAQGEYVARHDYDDISLPERLAREVAFLDEHPEVGMVGTWFQLIDAHGDTISDVFQLPTSPHQLAWLLYFYNPVAHSSVMLRRSVVEQVGGYKPTRDLAQDYSLWCRLLQRTKLSTIPSLSLYLRKHDANISLLRNDMVIESCLASLRALIRDRHGWPVSATVARALWIREYPSAWVGIQVAALIYRLYQNEWAKPGQSVEEQSVLQRDAADRVQGVFRTLPGSRLSWGRWCTLIWLARLNPTLANLELAGWLSLRRSAQ